MTVYEKKNAVKILLMNFTFFHFISEINTDIVDRFYVSVNSVCNPVLHAKGLKFNK